MGGFSGVGMNDDLVVERWSKAFEIVLITVGLSDGRMLFAERTLSPGSADDVDSTDISCSFSVLPARLSDGGDGDEDDDRDFCAIFRHR